MSPIKLCSQCFAPRYITEVESCQI